MTTTAKLQTGRIEQELARAREIQRRLLPGEFAEYSYLEVAGVNVSSDAVGGDYFDVVRLDEDRAAFVVADVAGKGLSAALLTALFQGVLVGLTLTSEPTRLIRQLNRYLWRRSESNRYATAIVGEINEDGMVKYINAGHLSGLLARRGYVTQVFESECLPIGLFQNADFHKNSARLEPGDTVLLFSDGLTEAANAAGEEFGMDRVSAVLADNHHLPVQELSEVILASVSEFTQRVRPADDMTLLVLRYTGNG